MTGVLPGMGGDFVKGASGPGNVYDTSPTGLGLSPAYLAPGASASASSSATILAELAYVEGGSSSPSITSSTESSPTSLSLDSGAISYEAIETTIECFFPAVATAAASNASVNFDLWDGVPGSGGTNLGTIAIVQTVSSASAIITPVFGRRFLTPTGGTHRYGIYAWNIGGTGQVYGTAAASPGILPYYLRITTGN